MAIARVNIIMTQYKSSRPLYGSLQHEHAIG